MRFFITIISLLIFNLIFCQIPINDNCSNSIDITIGQSGFQLGKFQSTQIDPFVTHLTVVTLSPVTVKLSCDEYVQL